MKWSIIGPEPRGGSGTTTDTEADRLGPSDIQRIRADAAAALHTLDSLIAAADARTRTGSWNPDAARTPADAGHLAFAETALNSRRLSNRSQPARFPRNVPIEHRVGGPILSIR